MSHFTVLVVGEDPEKQLQPFHEFECTGTDDEYVIDVDETEEKKQEYETGTASKMTSPSGELFEPWDERFYREPTVEEAKKIGSIAGTGCGSGMSWTSRDWKDGKGYRTKIAFVPEGFEEVRLNHSEIMSFKEYLSEYEEMPCVKVDEALTEDNKYHYFRVDETDKVSKVIRRTNPSAKWDWYQLGGRWNGTLKLKDNCSGTQGEVSWQSSPKPTEYVDQALIKDVDFETMRKEAEEKATWRYDTIKRVFDGEIPKIEVPWSEFINGEEYKDWDIKKKRDTYHNQVAMKRRQLAREKVDNLAQVKTEKEKELIRWFDLSDYQLSKTDYIKDAGDGSFSTFAVLKDGKWYERGEMGWWACVSNEKEEGDWNAEFSKLVSGLSEDTLISVYDCHI